MAKLLRVETVAARRGVTVQTVRRWIRLKGLPARRTSGGRGHWRIDAEALRLWLAERGENDDLN